MDLIKSIEHLLSDFAWYSDRAEWDALAKLFVAAGTLDVNGLLLTGPDDIAATLRLRAAGATRITRHTWSNLRVQMLNANCAGSTAIQVTFEQATAGAVAQLRVSDLVDSFEQDATGAWRFATRRVSRVMATS